MSKNIEICTEYIDNNFPRLPKRIRNESIESLTNDSDSVPRDYQPTEVDIIDYIIKIATTESGYFKPWQIEDDKEREQAIIKIKNLVSNWGYDGEV